MNHVGYSLNYNRSVFLASNSMHMMRDFTWMARTDFASQLTLHGDQDFSTNWRAVPQMMNHSSLICTQFCLGVKVKNSVKRTCLLSEFHRKVRERLGRDVWSYTWLSSPSPTNTRPIPCLWIVAHSHRCVTWIGKRNNMVCVQEDASIYSSVGTTKMKRRGDSKCQGNAHPEALLTCVPGNDW